MNRLAQELADQGFKGELMPDEPLSGHCSLKVGGPAGLLAVASDQEDVEIVVRFLKEKSMPWVVLGGGTNTLFVNGGFAGCVVKLGSGFSEVRVEGGTAVLAGASAPLQALVKQTGDEGLTGLECLAGIPGTVGGAVRMNAGTGTGEVSGTLEEAQVYGGGRIGWRQNSDLGFTYRRTKIRDGEVLLAARFKLARSDPDTVRRNISEQIVRRKKSQPLGLPSAGCWFRNPEGDSAGRLIDQAGLKGFRVGGAGVSDLHANFFVNTGEATADDFLSLARQVKESVKLRFDICLEEEVQVIHG